MPQRNAKPRKRRDRKGEVLDAARELFFRLGYAATTIQLIADKASYSKRSVYLDHKNKDDLFMTLCAEGGQLLLGMFRAIPAEALSVEDCIDAFLDVYLRFSREHAAYYRMMFSEATPAIVANCSGPVRARVAEIERDCLGVIVAWTERAMREGRIQQMDPWEAAGILVGAATGIVLLSMGGSQTIFSRERLESLVRSAIRTYWRGLQNHGPSSATPRRRTRGA